MDASIVGVAFAGGVLSFFTPCSLLGLFSFMSHVTAEGYGSKQGFMASVFYGAGYILTFSLIGIGLLFLPGFIIKQVWLRFFGGLVVCVMGIFMATDLVNRLKNKMGDPAKAVLGKAGRSDDGDENADGGKMAPVNTATGSQNALARSFIIGLSLGTSGIACVLPIFLGVITTILAVSDMLGGFIAFSFYALGMVVPIFIIGAGIGKLNELIIIKLVKLSSKIRMIFGIVLIVLGILYLNEALLILGAY